MTGVGAQRKLRWPDRFKWQLLTDVKALAAAMAYVDLNLQLVDFLWCVLQHVLPTGLCRVRHYGLCTAKPA